MLPAILPDMILLKLQQDALFLFWRCLAAFAKQLQFTDSLRTLYQEYCFSSTLFY